jgi:hypothetical protein
MNKDIRKTKTYKTMTSYIACSIAEGFADEPVTQEDAQAAWQWLLDTGTCWHLQGFYGRTVTDLLEQGLLVPPKESHKDFYGNTVQGSN